MTNLNALIMVVDGNAARDTLDEVNVITRFRGSIPDVLLENDDFHQNQSRGLAVDAALELASSCRGG